MGKEGPSVNDNVVATIEKDWTAEEEEKVKRKLDLLIMPLLISGYFCLQLDKGNIANALTDDFMEDVGITQNQFNVGQQLMSLGIVLFEFPSNMALYRVGAARWLTLQMFLLHNRQHIFMTNTQLSGSVSCFQAFQSSYASFMVTRFLLGITEAGFGPGGLWYISTWYTKKETAKRVMVFYFGIMSGQASSKLIAYGILHMRGVAGRSGWFWLFVLMGSFTCVNGLILGFLLPDSSKNPSSAFLHGVTLFSKREVHILKTRVLLDDPLKGQKKSWIGFGAFKKLLIDWRMWVHFLIALCNSGPTRGFDTYAPTIIRNLGFTALSSNALASVGLFLQIPVAFGFAFVSDRYSRRGETVITGLSFHMLSYIFDRVFSALNKQGSSYSGVVFTQMFGTLSQPLNVSWMSLACDDPEQRALAMALVIMGANIGGIYGAQLFRQDDRPHYLRAFSVACAIVAFGVACAVGRYVVGDIVLRRRQRRESIEGGTGSSSGGDVRVHGTPRVAITASNDNAETDGDTDEIRKIDVVVREGGELRVVDSAASEQASEMGMGTSKR